MEAARLADRAWVMEEQKVRNELEKVSPLLPLRLDDVVLHQDVVGQLELAQIEQTPALSVLLLRSAPPCCCSVFDEGPMGVY